MPHDVGQAECRAAAGGRSLIGKGLVGRGLVGRGRRSSPILLLLLLLVAASLGFGVPARAQDDELDLQVTGYGKFSPGAKFGLELSENTELASLVQARLKEALERHGFTYGKSSHLVMMVSAEKIGSSERPAGTTFDQSTSQFRLSMGNDQPPLGA